MRKWAAFTIIELLIIISIVTGLIMVAAPSFYNVFKQQFLIYDTHQLIQDIKEIQSNAFIENKYYKIGFIQNENVFKIWKYNTSTWELFESKTIDNNISLTYIDLLSDNNHIIYGPNGNAYLCGIMQSPTECQNQLTSQAKIKLFNAKKEIIIEFLPLNGYVSSNVSVK